MLQGIVSDIHGNLEALTAVWRAGEERGVERWVCLGDTVGYGADPAACLEEVRRRTPQALLGNHDAAVVGRLDPSYFNPLALAAVRWTAAALEAADRSYLAERPLVLEAEGAFFAHASPRRPERWDYVFGSAEAAEAMGASPSRLCFVGHTHSPFIARLGAGVVEAARDSAVELEDGARYLVNVGSVGQPRDGDPRACFALWDSGPDRVELVRVGYDIAAAQAKILAAGLPGRLASRLERGH